MKKEIKRNNSSKHWRILLVIGGIVVNVLLFFMAHKLRLTLFLDTIGTITVAGAIGIFPGILTAVISNTLCAIIDENSLYFMFVNVLLAMFTAWFVRRFRTKKIEMVILYAIVAGMGSGLMGALIQQLLFGKVLNTAILNMALPISESIGGHFFAAAAVANMLVNVLDKLLSTAVAYVIIVYVLGNKTSGMREGGWRQRPLSSIQRKNIKSWSRDVKLSSRARITMTLVGTSLFLVFIMGWIGVSLYFESEKEERTETAWQAVEFAANSLDANKFAEFVEKGSRANGYQEAEETLKRIRSSSRGVEYMYVVQVEDTGVRFILDLDDIDESNEGFESGEFVEFEPSFEPYINAMKAGEQIPAVESNGIWDWMVTVYYPVRAENSYYVYYIGADVSITYISSYMRRFILRVVIILAGYFVLIVAYALWTTDVFSTYPVSSMAELLDGFSVENEKQEQLDDNVKKIRALDINTGDEVEKLYKSICRLTLSQAEQMRSIRRLSESTARMQDGLIMTMADMVENRVSDMGAHSQRTSAYVRIILEGLKQKGYYLEKLTPKFMSDVVRSAPLYDVGKIKIPENILNKPGKLTPEEFEIVKKHASYGKAIMENAISSTNGENYLKEARNMAAYHHENWDGNGYPDGLHGEVIPLSARIMAVADSFDALTSEKTYRPAFSFEKSMEMIEDMAGSRLDPKCVEVFVDSYREVKVIFSKYNKSL